MYALVKGVIDASAYSGEAVRIVCEQPLKWKKKSSTINVKADASTKRRSWTSLASPSSSPPSLDGAINSSTLVGVGV